MTSRKIAVLTKVLLAVLVLFLVLGLLLVWLVDDFTFGLHTFSRIGPALTGSLLIVPLIVKYAWRLKWVATFLGVPVMRGTWTGHLESDWPPGEGSTTVRPIVLVIRQTLISISVTSLTQTMKGVSVSADVHFDEDSDSVEITYVYSLAKQFQAGAGFQQGAAELTLVSGAPNQLSGAYWTDSKTGGRLLVAFQTGDVLSSFVDVEKRWSQATWVRLPPSLPGRLPT